MPALHSSPLEVAIPGHTRRRVWSHPELTSHSLLVLTFERLYVAPNAGTPKPETLDAIENGVDLDELLGPLAVVIDLIAVRELKLDLLTNSIVIEYVGSGLGTSRQRITFANPEAADACFTKLWRRLGDGFELAPYQRDTWSLIRAPLSMLFVTLLTTAVLTLILSVFEDMALAREAAQVQTPGLGELGGESTIPKSPLELLIGWLDWRLVCGVGGVLAAVSQVWLYRRLTTPPVALELSRKP